MSSYKPRVRILCPVCKTQSKELNRDTCGPCRREKEHNTGRKEFDHRTRGWAKATLFREALEA